jgi:Tol biopolymer transport system component
LPGTSAAISADGRSVAFGSEAGLFVRDRQTGTIERIGDGSDAAISGDGRFVAFSAFSAGDYGLFVRDRLTGTTERLTGGWGWGMPAISGDGRFVAFGSSDNLVPGETHPDGGVYVRDRQTGTTEFVATTSYGGRSRSPSMSADGRFIVFASDAADLVPGDTVGGLFVRDRSAGTTQRVNVTTGGEPIDVYSGYSGFRPAISADGRLVAFLSSDGNVYVRDRQTAKTELASVGLGGKPANREGFSVAISGDGRFVAFQSYASNLVSGDVNDTADLFVRDRQTGMTERVSPSPPSYSPYSHPLPLPLGMSADGRIVCCTVFDSAGGDQRAVVCDRVAGTTETIGVPLNVGQTGMNSGDPAISAEGEWVAFVTTGQIFARNRVTGAAILVSATSGGAPGNRYSYAPVISGDGRFVAFYSAADDLVPEDTNRAQDVFVWNRETRKMELVSVSTGGTPANGNSDSPAISRDGRFVAFRSSASNLVPGHTGWGVYVRDLQTGKTEFVGATESDYPSHFYAPAISGDGRFVAFLSWAGNLVPGDTNGEPDIFVRDRQTGKTELVSATAEGAPGKRGSLSPSISGDGRFVAFESFADNLVPGDTNDGVDLFVRDRQSGKTELVSVGINGAPARYPSSGSSLSPTSISNDGRFVAFASNATNLVPDNREEWLEIYVRDRQLGKTELVSVSTSGKPAVGWTYFPAISADGRFVIFQAEDNLVSGDTNGRTDVFVAERQ